MDLRDYYVLLRRYWALMIAVTLAFGLIGFLFARQSEKQYRAVATILLRPNDPNERLGTSTQVGGENFVNTERYVQTQGDIAAGPDVLNATVARLGDIDLDGLHRVISVNPSANSNVLRVVAITPTPARSQQIANTLAEVFIENRRISSVTGLERAISDMSEKIDAIDSRMTAVNGGAQPSGDGSELATLRDQRRSLSDRRVELEIDARLKKGEAELIGRAALPKVSVGAQPLRTGALAAMLGIAAAAVVVLLRNRLDVRLRSRDEAEDLSGLSTLAEVPLDRLLVKESGGLIALTDPDGSTVEALRSLRVSLRFITSENPLQVLTVTSPLPGDGKSTTSSNLAILYAQAGARTLLVSADLRRPGVERLLAASPESDGLTDLLSTLASAVELRSLRSRRPRSTGDSAQPRLESNPELDITDWCQREIDNLFILPAGKSLSNPLEALGSPVMKKFVEMARDQFDMIILDTPPVVPVSDAIVLSQFADGIIVVVSVLKTARGALERTMEILGTSRTPVLGMVINRSDKRGPNYGGYYGQVANHKTA